MESATLTRALRLLVNAPQHSEKLLSFVLGGALADDQVDAETGTVYLRDPLVSLDEKREVARFASRVFVAKDGRAVEDTTVPALNRFHVGDGTMGGQVLKSGKFHVAANCKKCKYYKPSKDLPQFKSLMCVPIIYGETAAGDPRILGLMNLHTTSSSRPWNAKHVTLVEAWAHMAALVLRANNHELTMLPNRALMEYTISKLIHDSASSSPFYLAFVDMDRFGSINEHFGHRPADELIVRFANLLRNEAGPGSRVFHIHGDEFVVLVENDNRDEALAKFRAIQKHILANQSRLSI